MTKIKMTKDEGQYDIVKKYGLPRDHVSCPGCGNIYGAYNREVCKACQECSKCCYCDTPDLMKAEKFVTEELIPYL